MYHLYRDAHVTTDMVINYYNRYNAIELYIKC